MVTSSVVGVPPPLLRGLDVHRPSRLLAAWARNGVLEVGHERVTVRSPAALRRLAETGEPA